VGSRIERIVQARHWDLAAGRRPIWLGQHSFFLLASILLPRHEFVEAMFGTSRAKSVRFNSLLARPKRFELLTPRFVVCELRPSVSADNRSRGMGSGMGEKALPLRTSFRSDIYSGNCADSLTAVESKLRCRTVNRHRGHREHRNDP
jgi:hypothetical protein